MGIKHIKSASRRRKTESRDSAAVSPLMREFAGYIAGAARKPLPAEASEACKHHILDTLAAMVSGSRLLPGKKAIEYIKLLGGKREACVPGSRILTNVVNAALAGGMLAHADETDDGHAATLTHPGCAVVPAALAMAESRGAGGAAFLRAVALGYDVCIRTSRALGAYDFFAGGHSTDSYCPVFGAAAAAGSIAGLDAGQVRHMLSYTAQQASGISYYARDTDHIEKAFDVGGMPARNGVYAATMVAAGMTGVDDAFSGERNFFFACGPTSKPAELLRRLGKTFEITNTGIKKWSVGNPAQAPLDSLSALIKAHRLKPADVETIVIRIYHQGANTVGNRDMPAICMQYLAAIMLIDGTVTFASAHDESRMRDPRVQDIRRRVELYGDDDLDRAMPVRQGIVELKLRDGRQLRHHTRQVRGTMRNPLTRQEVEEKSHSLLGPVLGPLQARNLINAVWRMEKIGDLREIRPMLQT